MSLLFKHSCDLFFSPFCVAESKEVYKRQVLSITSIAMAISLLGTLCMALYCRNKLVDEKHTQKHTDTHTHTLEAPDTHVDHIKKKERCFIAIRRVLYCYPWSCQIPTITQDTRAVTVCGCHWGPVDVQCST